MIDAFVEGVRSLDQVCHLVIVLPVALTIVAARGQWQASLAALAGVLVGGWIFVAGWVGVTDLRVRLSAVIVVVALVGLILPIAVPDDGNSLSRLRNALAQPWISALLTGLVALIVTHWWRPCVGIELGSILTAAPDDPIGQLPATVGFMLGISIPLLLVALTFVAARPTGLFAGRLAWGGATLCTVLAVSVIAGQHGEIVSRLFQWSQ